MKSRCDDLLTVLAADSVNLRDLKRLCMNGCPDIAGIRAKCWKLLLNYIPINASERDASLRTHRREYASFVQEFVVASENGDSSDHPLSSSPGGRWKNFFEDNEVLFQIYQDCRRLCPDFDFFHRITEFPSNILFGDVVPVGVLRRRVETPSVQSLSVNQNLAGASSTAPTPLHNPFQTSRRSTTSSFTIGNGNGTESESNQTSETHRPIEGEQHWEVIQRILYVYYKTHGAPGYIQGMNEVIAPIYFLFANDADTRWRSQAEADTFYCFNNLMTEIHHNFIRKLDHCTPTGIGGQLHMLSQLLAQFDQPLCDHFNQIGLQGEHYAFRWVSLLLAREFALPDVIRLWDSLFSDEKRFAILPFVCCAMLILIRDELLSADFATAVHLVQFIPNEMQRNSPGHELYDNVVVLCSLVKEEEMLNRLSNSGNSVSDPNPVVGPNVIKP